MLHILGTHIQTRINHYLLQCKQQQQQQQPFYDHYRGQPVLAGILG